MTKKWKVVNVAAVVAFSAILTAAQMSMPASSAPAKSSAAPKTLTGVVSDAICGAHRSVRRNEGGARRLTDSGASVARNAMGHRFQGATECHVRDVLMAVARGKGRSLLIRSFLDAMLATNCRRCAQRCDQQQYKYELGCASQSLPSQG